MLKHRSKTPTLLLTTRPPSPCVDIPNEIICHAQPSPTENYLSPRELELQRLREEAIKKFPRHALRKFFHERSTKAIEEYIQQGIARFDLQQNANLPPESSVFPSELKLKQLREEAVKKYPGQALRTLLLWGTEVMIENEVRQGLEIFDSQHKRL